MSKKPEPDGSGFLMKSLRETVIPLSVFGHFPLGGSKGLLLASPYNDYKMAKSQKAFRRAALPRSQTGWLFGHIVISMSIGRMTRWVIRCQTCRLAARTIEFAIVLAIR